MDFFSFILLLAIAYLLWRISDQLPDILFRLSEVQRDIAEIRRRGDDDSAATGAVATPAPAADTQDDGTPDATTPDASGGTATTD